MDVEVQRGSDEEFTFHFKTCMDKLGWDETTMADWLRVSRPTVRRWLGGKNLPHPSFRPVILNAVKQAAGLE